MNKATNIKAGDTVEHCNLGIVRVLQVTAKGVIVLQTAGREEAKRTTEHRVAKRDLYAV